MNKTIQRLTYIAVAMMLFPGLTGCHSSKRATTATPTEQRISTSSREAAKLTETTEKQWDKMRSSLKVALKSPETITLSGTAWMQRGERIQISLKFMGLMEVVVIDMSKETTMIVDKYHKIYLLEPTETILGNSQITIADIQDILIGQPFTTPQLPKGYELVMTLDAASVMQQIALVLPKQTITCTYSDRTPTEYGAWANTMSFDEQIAGKRVAGSLGWRFDSAKWNDDVTMRNTSEPTGYNRVSLQSLKTQILRLSAK